MDRMKDDVAIKEVPTEMATDRYNIYVRSLNDMFY